MSATPSWRGRFGIFGLILLLSLAPTGGQAAPTPAPGPPAALAAPTRAALAPTGVWLPTRSMIANRTNHTATLLADGRVLVTGGSYGPVGHGNAEMYDPATGAWQAAGEMALPRQYHSATPLTNGTVLVVGGELAATGTPVVVGLAEIFDPSATTWRPANSLLAPRSAHTATLLADGSVLVVGGRGPDGKARASAERYNPATGAWSAVGNLTTPRTLHTATRLASGEVLVLGGEIPTFGSATTPLNSAEIFSPATGTWRAAASMMAGRASHTATLLDDGRVLVVGGHRPFDGPDAEVYDPAANTWSTPARASATDRTMHTATLMANGTVIVTGGASVSAPYSSSEEFDPMTQTWRELGQMMQGRARHTATRLVDGRLLVVGASFLAPNAESSGAEIYDPAQTTAWRVAASPVVGRTAFSATPLLDGRVLIAGGQRGSGAYAGAELYHPATDTWTQTGSLNTARLDHHATRLPDGRVLVMGGLQALPYGPPVTSAELYDPASGQWQPVRDWPPAGSDPPVITNLLALNSRLVLVVATVFSAGRFSKQVAYLYDIALDLWRAAADPPLHMVQTVTLLADGRVLAIDAVTDPDGSVTAVIYDPAADTWSPTGRPVIPGHGHSATRLAGGQVLLISQCCLPTGQPGSTSGTALYDPTTGVWGPGPTLILRHFRTRVVPLVNGKVLVIGSTLDANGPLPFASGVAEVFDPATGQSTPVGHPHRIRAAARAVALDNGAVLVMGYGFPDQGVEIYGAPGSPPVLGAAADTTWHFAEGFRGAGFDQYLVVQNPGPATTARLTYFAPFEFGPVIRSLALPAQSRTTVSVFNLASPQNPGGLGRREGTFAGDVGALIESAAPIVVERPMYFAYGQGITGGHDALGHPMPGRVWYFAEGYTGPGFDEYLTILNPTPNQSQARISYVVEGATTPTVRTVGLPARSRLTVAVHEPSDPGVGSGGLGRVAAGHAIKVESTANVVVERALYFQYQGGVDGGHVVMGATAARPVWLFAEGYTGPGFDEYLTIFNPGAAGSATITYAIEGRTTPETRAVPLAAASRTTVRVHEPPSAANPGGLGRLTAGHAIGVASSVPIVVERSLYFTYGSGITGGHTTMGAAATATRWSFAEGYTGSGFDEYLTIFNPGAAGTATVTYAVEGRATPETRTVPLAAASRTTVRVHEPPSPTNPGGLGRIGAGHSMIVASSVPVVVERPIYFTYGTGITGGHNSLGHPN